MSKTPSSGSLDNSSNTPNPRRWWGLMILALPAALIAVDNTVLSFAVPQLSETLRPSATELLWVIDSYSLILAGTLVAMGAIGDRFGRRRLLMIGLIGFGLVSVFCAFSPSVTHLIIGRFLLGLFGATLMPSTLALIRTLFEDHNERRFAVAIWGSAFSAGMVLGPIIGGSLLTHFWWGSVFLLNVPIVLLSLIFLPIVITESKDKSAGKIDLISVAQSMATMLPLAYAIKILFISIDSTTGWIALVISVINGWIFIKRQRKLSYPLLDLSLFSNRLFTSAIIANFFSIMAMAGLILLLSQYLQLVLNYSAIIAGYMMIPGTLITIIAGIAISQIAKNISIRILIPIGLLLGAIGYGLAVFLSLTSHPALLFIIIYTIIGAGTGIAETLTGDLILNSAPVKRAGAASAISETAYELGAAFGVAVLGSISSLVYRLNLHLDSNIYTAEQLNQVEQTLGGALEIAKSLPESVAQTLVSHAKNAFSLSVDVSLGVVGGILILITILTYIQLRKAEKEQYPVS